MVRMMAKMEWKDPARESVPLGVPLIVSIRASWKNWPEVLGPVYRLKNAVNGGVEYVNFGAGAELGSIENSVIGPEGVEIIAWDFWPVAYREEEIQNDQG